MAASLQVRIIGEDRKIQFTGDISRRTELGRQDRGQPAPFTQSDEGDHDRLVIAPLTDYTVGRQLLSIEPLDGGQCRIVNLHQASSIRLVNGDEIKPREERVLTLPSQFLVGRKLLKVSIPEPPPDSSEVLNELAEATMPPGRFDGLATRATSLPLPQLIGGDLTVIQKWLEAAMDVLQAASNDTDFFEKAAQNAVEMVKLDTARVMLLRNDVWQTAASYTSARLGNASSPPASMSILKRMRDQVKTIWNKPEANTNPTASIDALSAVVAAPILNQHNEVIGALYGDRSAGAPLAQRGDITEPEATLVNLLARMIASGLARLKHEKEMAAERVKFEQFFTTDLAQQLERKPDLLDGKDSEVTVLFCDIRGFSRISHKVGPAKTVEWMNEVMGVLSDAVLDRHGVLVDYIGDELMAMWGAPDEQPDHAVLASRAALDMLCRLPELRKKWEPELGEQFDLGIGLNTGRARVGNTGSRRKFKYGPLGSPVNLASRIQGATKHFKARLLVTKATRDRLDDSFRARRLGLIRVININDPVDVYELVPEDHPDWQILQAEYEVALHHFEEQEFRHAARILGTLSVEHQHDGPSLVLLSRVVNVLSEREPFDKVWTLPSK